MTAWQTDILPGFQSREIALPGAELAFGEPEIQLSATLVRKNLEDADTLDDRAILYVHGWNDYFFQTELASRLTAQGIRFYALDLRRYGRSLREGLYRGYISDISHYFTELEAAIEIIKADGYSRISLMGHSTGGLVQSLFAAHCRAQEKTEIVALMLNSPWLDLAASSAMRKVLKPLAQIWSKVSPVSEIPMPEDPGYYAHSSHISLGGIWDYDFAWKSPKAVPILAGWIRAILAGQEEIAKGLDLDIPVLCCSSDRSIFIGTWDPDIARVDCVLDVEMIAKRSLALGSCVTRQKILGGMHDLALSDEDARNRYYDAIAKWSQAYYPRVC